MLMNTVIIWGLGYDYNQYINCIKLQEIMGEIYIAGVTDSKLQYPCLDGYTFIPVNEIQGGGYYAVITSHVYFNEIFQKARELGFDSDHIIPAKVFSLPNFRFSQYVKLIESHISIIANNCWGGIISHSLGLPFRSPFVNMFEHDNDYIKLLYDLKGYLEKEVIFQKMAYTEHLQRYFPICTLGDITLYFNHYVSMEEVNEKWHRRLKRINWDNLFVMMYTDNEEMAQAFDTFNYKKKICFVPFKCNLKSAYTLELAEKTDLPFWNIVNRIADGRMVDYDFIELLNTGRIIQNRYFVKSQQYRSIDEIRM